jgi:predicted transcriptional regulator
MENDKLDIIIDYLNTLTKIELSKLKEKLLSNEEMKQVYESTGELKSREICKKLKISATTLSNYWKEWEEKGLLKKDGQSYLKVLK